MPKPILSRNLAWLTPPNDERHEPAYHFFEDAAAHPFDDRAPAFALVNACWLADAALLAYSDRDVVAAHFKTVKMETTPFDVSGTHCYVAHDARKVIVTFRGTQVLKPAAGSLGDLALLEVLRNWLTDARVRVVVDGPRGDVHEGFLAALNAVWADVDGSRGLAGHLADLAADAPERTFWFTGHSLGGALATLAAGRFDRGPAALYTYGSPRVGDDAFRQAFGDRPAYRFVHAHDVVPTVPHVAFYARLRAPELFAHVGQLFEVGSDGRIVARVADAPDRAGEWRQLPARLLEEVQALGTEWWSTLLPDGLVDHAPTFYASLLWNAYEARGDEAVQRGGAT